MGIIRLSMSTRPKRRKEKKEEDWIYDPIVVKGVLRAKKEADEAIKAGKHLHTLEEILEEFHREDAKKIQD